MTDRALPPHSTADAQLPSAADRLINDGKVMSIFEHLAELRSRIVKSVLVIFVAFGICFAYATEIMIFLKGPLVRSLPPNVDALHFTGPMDVFMVDMRVALLASVVLTCPFWVYQFWKFFEPALYPKERRYILPFVVATAFQFFLGVVLCFFWVMPMMLSFLLNLGMEVGVPVITITDYVSLLTTMVFSFGLVFETPVVLVLLGVLEIVTTEMLTKHRRIIIVLILILTAIIAPPDITTWLALSVPVYGMYELAIVIIRFIEKRKKKSQQTAG